MLINKFIYRHQKPSFLSALFQRTFSNEKSSILKGIRVLDLSRILVGPFCTMYLADLGAEVIKVESFEGDETRRWGPPFLGEDSTYYLSINRSKKSIVIDLKSEEGIQITNDLVKVSDVLVENFSKGVTEKLKLDYDHVKTINDKLIYASVTGYGSYGPDSNKPGFDLIAQAISGLMHITGDPEPAGKPLKFGVAITDLVTGLNITNGILAALYSRKLTGKGQKVETSLLEASVGALANISSAYLNGNLEAKRYGNHHASIMPYGVYKVGESGYLAIGCATNRQFVLMCEAINRKDIPLNEKFKTNGLRVMNRKELEKILEDEFSKYDVKTLTKLLEEKKIPCGPINNIKSVFDDEQVKALGLVKEIESKRHKKVKVVRNPLKFSESSIEEYKAPPGLGEHTDIILQDILGYNQEKIIDLRKKKIII